MQLIINIIKKVDGLIGQQAWIRLDTLLHQLQFTNLTEAELIAYARATYPVRIKLKYWDEYVADVAEELNRRGKDAQRMLKGLI